MSEKGVADNYVAKTDISNITGTDTTKVPSLQCLNDNYVPKSGGLINGTIGITGDIEILGSETLKLSTDGSITFPERISRLTGIADDKGTSSTLAISQKGVADNYLPFSGGTVSGDLVVGTSTAKRNTEINGNLFVNGCKITGTSSGVGTSATEMPTLKCLHDNYLALSGGTLSGQLTLSSNGIKFNTNAIKDVTYSTTDLVAGTSTLATNSIYIVYE